MQNINKIEPIVQILYYFLVLLLALGLIGYNGEPVFAPQVRNILIYVTVSSIISFLVYYYIAKRKKR